MAIDFSSKFSENAMMMRASEIRELLKLTNKPGVISFAGGLPDPAIFPVEEIREIAEDVILKKSVSALQYSSTEGLPELREEISKKFHKGKFSPENIFMSTGSQEGLDIVGKIFIDPGDNIIVSAPTYLGAITAFKAYRPNFITIPMDNDGMRMDILERELESIYSKGHTVKFLYTIPSYHNPYGSTMPLERRKKMAKLAEEYDLIIVEDDPYRELKYVDEDLPKLIDLAPERTIYMSTFSKIMAPSMRLGWNIAPDGIYQKMIICKQSVDLCSSALTQHLAYEFLNGGYLEPHIAKIRESYGHKKDVMLESLESYFPEGTEWTKPKGGMFLWVTLDGNINTRKMFPLALEHNIAYVIGGAFYPNGGGDDAMRLNFSFSTPEIIREGVKRLAEVVEKELNTAPVSSPVLK